ncbi:glycosyltransferase [Paludisphaera rhizosphaerae]|uniref:glycosyltransferase n=1 Tax=Paludisphaera rhizosphaerae TaxID=2711216 RepID=UPI0013EC8460|nr:glycosyltransferase [Paludisphaera rhizosphaerae]
MDVALYLSEASFWTSERSSEPFGRTPFTPVASWLVDAARPRWLVQLGLREPGVYFALCDAVRRLGLDARCAVVDIVPDDEGQSFAQASLKRIRGAHDRNYSAVSRRLQLQTDECVDAFDDATIDVLHLATSEDAEAFLSAFDAWRPKLSDRAVLILPRTCVSGRSGGADAFRKLAARHPSFEFTHGEGLGLIAVGSMIPRRLQALFDADAIPARRNIIRSIYARLGAAAAPRDEADSILAIRDSETEAMTGGDAAAVVALREQLYMLRDELAAVDDRRQTVALERDALARMEPELRRDLDFHKDRHEAYRTLLTETQRRLNELQASPVLATVDRLRQARRRYFPETRLHGRCLRLTLRFVRTAATDGLRPALGRVSRRFQSKARKSLGLTPPPAPPVETAPISEDAQPLATTPFESLPWRWTGEESRDGTARARASFKILLVSHSACRTGAPLCLLRLCEELSKLPDFECWMVLKTGGELEDEFAKVAPTLHVGDLVHAGLCPWSDTPWAVASRFREYAPDGIAVCNTMAVSHFHEALAAAGVPVFSWIHELPTFIDILGGDEAIARIKAASRRTIVPADVVRDSLVSGFGIDRERVQTVRYGLDARTPDVSREEARRAVRAELGLPDDARIVLGCGTIDLRKGADVFVQVGVKYLAEAEPGENTWFVWFGKVVDKNFARWIQHDAEIVGVADRVVFAGVREDLTPYLCAADLFLLTSREDPCPFANLEAMEAALPVVAFENSGGAPEVLGGGGVVVPYVDVIAMAQAVRKLLSDPNGLLEMGRQGRDLIRGQFTWPRFMGEFLGILQSHFGYRPRPELKVSVIVPNYRHAPFLEERLRSVFDQTVRPHEIIFLDDASPDDSVEVARRLAPLAPVPMRIVVNEKNSGSTFRQWLKGMELATGDLIWFAESDDSAHPRFLEKLIPEFHDPEVVLAYSQSALIGPRGERWASDFLGHTDDLNPGRWRSRYKASGAEEAEVGLSQKNTIPNASAVLFRKPAQIDFAEELSGMRFAGDWLFYGLILRGGKIAFVPESLNRYRRHDQTVSFESLKADTHAEETLYAKFRIFETFDVSLNAMTRSLGQTLFEYDFLTENFGLKRPPLSANVRAAGPLAKIVARMRGKLGSPEGQRVLLVADGRETGTAAATTADLANALAVDHQVFVCCAWPSPANAALASLLDDGVALLEGTLGVTPWSAAPEDPVASASRLRETILQELIRIHQIEVIHSRSDSADRLVAQVAAGLNVPWFVHMNPGRDGWMNDWPVADRISGVFYEDPSALSVSETRPELASKRWIRLHPAFGMETSAFPASPKIIRRDGEFLVYLIADDPAEAMAAVRIVNRLGAAELGGRRVRLVMTGPPIEEADRATAVAVPHGDPRGLMSQCDAALAPQANPGPEALGLAALAFSCRLPIIAPEGGVIHELATLDGLTAGIAAKLDGRASLDAHRMAAAILRYLGDADLYDAHCDLAGAVSDANFRIERAAAVCSEAYAHARDFVVFRRDGRPTIAPPEQARGASRGTA